VHFGRSFNLLFWFVDIEIISEIHRSNLCESHVLNKDSEIPFRVALNPERSLRQDRRTHLRQRLEVVLVNKTRANGGTVIKFASKIGQAIPQQH
jgi:hypothetical protein